MNFILFIKCIDKDGIDYHNTTYDLLKESNMKFDFIDLDNLSEVYLIDQAKKAIEISVKSVVFFDLKSECNMNAYINIATFLIDNPDKTRVFIDGKNPLIEKIIFPKEDFSFYNYTLKQKIELAQSFFKS